MDGLIIKQPFIDYILDGSKTWELRGSKTNKRGRIALIRSGSGLIVGEVDLIDCKGPLSNKEYTKNKDKHKSSSLFRDRHYKKTYAWILKNPQLYNKSIPYSHPQGAIIWVKLPDKSQKTLI